MWWGPCPTLVLFQVGLDTFFYIVIGYAWTNGPLALSMCGALKSFRHEHFLRGDTKELKDLRADRRGFECLISIIKCFRDQTASNTYNI
jgi:hypothetical protein